MRTQEVIRGLAILVFMGGCHALPEAPPLYVARLDADHVVRQRGSASDSTGVQFYREGLSQILGSECKQFPTDSRFALQASRSCGAMRGTVLSFARFAKEEDNHLLGKPRIFHPRRLIYADLDSSCAF